MGQTTFNVSAAYDKSVYNAGELMTISLSGNATFTDTIVTDTQSGSLDQTITAENGEVTHIISPSVTIKVTNNISEPKECVISAITATDGRVWTIAANGKSATATA